MSNIKFVSHEQFPEDQYTKELVYLEINAPARVAFIRKQAKNGGMFWSVANVGISKDGGKVYYETYMQDSVFLEKDIKNFLDKRAWTDGKTIAKSIVSDEEIPF